MSYAMGSNSTKRRFAAPTLGDPAEVEEARYRHLGSLESIVAEVLKRHRSELLAQHGVGTTRGPIVDVIHEDGDDLAGPCRMPRPYAGSPCVPPDWLTFG